MAGVAMSHTGAAGPCAARALTQMEQCDTWTPRQPLPRLDLSRLYIRGNRDQKPGSGYGDYWHGVLLRVVYESHIVPR